MNNFKVQGMYTLKKYNAATGALIESVGPFCNVITNLGLNAIGPRISGVSTYGYVGTGTAPASPTDVSMGLYKTTGSYTNEASSRGPAPYYWAQISTTYRFAEGTISGNITEVGVGTSPTGNNTLWSRELIVDSAGNPITITILPNEILDLVYTLRYYPNLSDFSGVITLNSIDYNYTAKPANITQARVDMSLFPPRADVEVFCYGVNTTFGPITGSLMGMDGNSSTGLVRETLPYVNNSYYRDCVTTFALDSNPPDGLIAGLIIRTSGFITTTHQLLFSPRVPKTNENTMTLTFRQSWGRYTGPIA